MVGAGRAVVVTATSGPFSGDSTRLNASAGLAPSAELLLQPVIRHSAIAKRVPFTPESVTLGL